MKLLPHWSLTGKNPAFYDTESATAIEQTAKVYGAMQSLIEEYNGFVDTLNKEIETFEASSKEEAEAFKLCITGIVSDYIQSIDMRMDEATVYMKANLRATAEELLNEIIVDLKEDMEAFEQDRAYFQEEFAKQTEDIKQQNVTLSNAISTMETAIDEQNGRIDEAVEYMQTNLQSTIDSTVERMITNGEIVMGLGYKEDEESLSFTARNIGEPTDLALTYDATKEAILLREVPAE